MKQARTASRTGALSDLRKHHLAENGGSTTTGETLRNLTPRALRPLRWSCGARCRRMGSTARGAGSSEASHPMAVNETVIALLRLKPNLAKFADDPPHIQAAVDIPPGTGTTAS
ncbi:hypothetical protein ACIQRK_34040 [Streptomyces anulatus]